jgi:hypothetical protein
MYNPRKVVRRIVEPDVAEFDLKEADAEEAEGIRLFGRNPWKVIGGGLLLAFLLFAPLCTVTETVQETQTIMVPGPTKELPPARPGEKTIKVYQGYILDINGTTTPIDAVNGIVNKSKAIGPPVWGGTKTWVITLTDIDGIQTIYRDIVTEDLTPTGTLRVDNTGAQVFTPTSELVPKEVTTQKEVKSRVNFMQYLLEFGCQPYPSSR